MKQWLRKIVPSFIRKRRDFQNIKRRWSEPDQPLVRRPDASGLEAFEQRVYSQNFEDGIIAHVFQNIGFRSRRSVEFGFGAAECNTLRLMLHENFNSFFMDGSRENCALFNDASEKLAGGRGKAVGLFITLDNLEETIQRNGFAGDLDVLSIDVDGNDYWFWKKLGNVSPRLVVIEYNASLGPRSITIPYDAAFDRHAKHPSGWYAGASLPALANLAGEKGYRLIGCDSWGANAFFLRRDEPAASLPAVEPSVAFRPNKHRTSRGFSTEAQFEVIKNMPFVSV